MAASFTTGPAAVWIVRPWSIPASWIAGTCQMLDSRRTSRRLADRLRVRSACARVRDSSRFGPAQEREYLGPKVAQAVLPIDRPRNEGLNQSLSIQGSSAGVPS